MPGVEAGRLDERGERLRIGDSIKCPEEREGDDEVEAC